MKHIYHIETCGVGHFWEEDVDCPLFWRGSGCYDVEYECYQEVDFSVVADTLEEALKLIGEVFEKYNKGYSYTLDGILYDPDTVEEKPDEEDGRSEVFDYNYSEPVNGESIEVPERYSEEIEL